MHFNVIHKQCPQSLLLSDDPSSIPIPLGRPPLPQMTPLPVHRLLPLTPLHEAGQALHKQLVAIRVLPQEVPGLGVACGRPEAGPQVSAAMPVPHVGSWDVCTSVSATRHWEELFSFSAESE